MHWLEPGVHAPQLPPVQALEHAAPLACQVPVESHDCGCKPLHWSDPGEQTPVQAPPLQTYEQGLPLFCQVPSEPHDCGCKPLHWLVPGEQTPVQPPPLQT